jgi:hypothetical protein
MSLAETSNRGLPWQFRDMRSPEAKVKESELERAIFLKRLTSGIVSNLATEGNLYRISYNPRTAILKGAKDSELRAFRICGHEITRKLPADLKDEELNEIKNFLIEGIMDTLSDSSFLKELNERGIFISTSDNVRFQIKIPENKSCSEWNMREILSEHFLPHAEKKVEISSSRKSRHSTGKIGKRKDCLEGKENGESDRETAKRMQVPITWVIDIRNNYELKDGNAIRKDKNNPKSVIIP